MILARIALGLGAAALFALPPSAAQPLPGTRPLTSEGDLTIQMLKGIDRFLDRETSASVERRERRWKRDFSSPEAYEKSVADNRNRLRRIIGVVDERLRFDSLSLDATTTGPALIAEGAGYAVHAVRWPVLNSVDAEGLLLEPAGSPSANVVALPDAGWTPEMLAGLTPGVAAPAQFARRLAENGCRVLVPVLIDRSDRWSGHPEVHLTNLPHREMVYRMAYQVGRHIVGYEVQKVLAAADWFSRQSPQRRIGVIGYGEGGLIALYSGAVDPRIDVTLVSGYFEPRENLWQEPLYRNVWSLLDEFGDAELAGLVAPRRLIVEAARGPEAAGPRRAEAGRSGNAAPGRLHPPQLSEVKREFERARPFFGKLGARQKLSLVVSGNGTGDPGSTESLSLFLKALGASGALTPSGEAPADRRSSFDTAVRLRRQFEQLIAYSQRLARKSESVRRKFWEKADVSSPERWEKSLEPYRRYFREEITGAFPPASEPLEVRTRRRYDEPKWTGYEVYIPVWPDVFAYGVLLVPKDVKQDERRPVVVCQHGVNNGPQPLVDPKIKSAYNHFAARLADRGFIAYAPQNPYTGEPKFPFRLFQRKANPLKRSIFSLVLAQHERTLEWLAQLPFVDPERIAFYGLSYGGETALRIPPLLKQYALSISSGNFTEWVWKTTRWDHGSSFLYRGGYDHYDFDIANTFNGADLANMMTPRPFMVERGHNDGVGPDEWVAYEYAKVRRHYAVLGIPDRARIEFFNAGHEIHGVGTFEFLHQHLRWPEPAEGHK